MLVPTTLGLPKPADTSDTDEPTAVLRSPADHPWVMEPEGTAARHWAMPLCRNAGFEPDVRFGTAGLLLHQRLVEQQHAAAFPPELVFSGQPPTVAHQQLPRGRRTRRVFTVVRQGRSRHPAALACRNALRRARRQTGTVRFRPRRRRRRHVARPNPVAAMAPAMVSRILWGRSGCRLRSGAERY
ncbi:LysR substrate-binding domain-containing protein [Streptomyces niveiscabiei]|uniref:LysR substrate-binding domain-containing protein n=1 Tax=Streptomyces niveiscabiei TaxID=164115 RepID=UPI0029A03F1F|nr:LysR substrate-binding domain-containing protein [Streptomyces niveiscabiei]MDX3386096.1 LysR substrate-binding domain-containing protein [Streptomyces niveiscabiei]